MNRRTFIKNSSLASISLTSSFLPFNTFKEKITKITILHTNDVHSRIEPFPMDGGRNQGLGGVAKRATLIERIRSENKNTLLFDAGDAFQGTPYFNLYQGEIEFKLMNSLKYDAMTLGNHDFDGGIDLLAKQIDILDFPVLNANYDLSGTVLNEKVLPYKVFKKSGIKIGVFGLGIDFDGLVPKSLHKEAKYLDPLPIADKISNHLKNDLKCDYIICLSHLGYKYKEDKVSDHVLAQKTQHIDLIIGGHTHTFLNKPDRIKNENGKVVLVTQAGYGGILLGRIDLQFEKNKKGECTSCTNLIVE